jgi:iron(III) transport system permease protein
MSQHRLPWNLWLWIALLVAASATFSQLDGRVERLLLNTLWLIAGVEAIAVPVGVLLAVALAKTNVPARRAAELLTIALLFIPLYMYVGAWDAGFGIQGWHTLTTNPHLARQPWLSGWRAAAWIHAMAAIPWVAMIVAAALRTVDSELEEDALLRMPACLVVIRVSLRRAASALFVAAIWVAIVASAEISVTDVYQYRTFAEEVYTQAALGAFDFAPADSESLAAASQAAASSATQAAGGAQSTQVQVDPALSVRSLWYGLALVVLLVLAALVAGGRLCDDIVHAPERPPWHWHLKAARWPVAAALWLAMLVLAGVPLANLMYKAGVQIESTAAGRVRNWSATKVVSGVTAAPWQNRAELWQSAQIAGTAATAALIIGLPLAWTMRSASSLPWLRLAALAFLLALPGPLLGIAFIRILNRPPGSPLAALAWLYDTNFAPWLVQTIRALPIVTLILWPALASIPQATLDSAATEGAGWWRRLLGIAVPQRWPVLAAAWLVGLAIAIGELAATILVVPPGPTTISVRIFSLIHYGVDDRVASICLVLIGALAALTLVGMFILPARRRTVTQPASNSLE